jgi:hypothetical protein
MRLRQGNGIQRGVFGGRDVEALAFVFAMTGDAGADSEVGATINQKFDAFGVRRVKVGQCVKDRGLAADAVRVDLGARVYVGASVEKEAAGVEEPVFSGDVKEGCAAETDIAAGGAAVHLGVAAAE